VLERPCDFSTTIGELAEPSAARRPSRRKHVGLLEEAILVATEQVGRARGCTPVPYAFETGSNAVAAARPLRAGCPLKADGTSRGRSPHQSRLSPDVPTVALYSHRAKRSIKVVDVRVDVASTPGHRLG